MMQARKADSMQQDQLLCALKQTFGFGAFRGVQEAAVTAVLAGRDVFVLMPTGGGKSLCYALPAVVAGGLVVVVSPLIALMQDQVAGLQARGVAADYLSSSRSTAERQVLLDRLSALPGRAAGGPPTAKVAGGNNLAGTSTGSASGSDNLLLLYVTPELLATDSFRQRLVALHGRRALQLLAVDEAHSISSWGHDFRPKFRQLGALRRQLPGLPCLALTATATPQVQQDILASLSMTRNPLVLQQSFNRPNIHYSVVLLDVLQDRGCGCGAQPAAGAAALSSALGDEEAEEAGADHAGYGHLLTLLKTPIQPAAGQDGKKQPQGPVSIVYALKRQTVDALCRRLAAAGLRVAGYHAGLKDAIRSQVLERWRGGELQVVVSTVAFGMGVDKGDIDLVVHFNLPKSVEGFYQESGRAGRMGQLARSVLFYATRDRQRMDWILQKEQERKAGKKRKARSGKDAAAAGSSDAAPAAADLAAAGAGVRAFGAVVQLCVATGCRRARLLKHFGEELPADQASQPQQRRCCDACDSPAAVASAVAQLQQREAQLLQQRYAGPAGAGGWGTGKRRRQDGGSGGLFDGLDGFEDSDDDGEGGTGSADDDDQEQEPDGDSAAAAAAVRQAAAAAKAAAGAGSQGRQGGKGGAAQTAAFLSAMEAAEARHERAAAAAAHAGGAGDVLSRLTQAREGPAKQSAAVPEDVRAARRSKLAQLLQANQALSGLTPALAADLAADMEAAVFSHPDMLSATHRAGLAKLAASVRAAGSWAKLALELSALPSRSLGAVLKLAVAAVVKDAGAGREDGGGSAAVVAALQQLAALPVTVEVLEASGAARQVKALRKHSDPAVAAAAASVIAAWRAAVG